MKAVVSTLATILKKDTSTIVAIGHKGLETGVVVRLIETVNDKPILDGWSFGGYGGQRLNWERNLMSTVGVAIEKSLFKKPTYDIGAGVLVTTPVRDFLNKSSINIAGGISIKF